ncbi:hypothetical protein [Blautia obeum]|nr:hypothetical protein [Blautia obeum]
MLKDEGFDVHHDESVSKIIRRNHIEGIRRDLKFKAQRFPAGFEIVFYQDVVHENPHGGFYDFDKRRKMPYLIGLQYEKYMNLIVKKIKSLVEVEDKSSIKTKTAEEWVKARYVESCHYPQTDMNFDLHALDGQGHEGRYGLDRDGKEIHNGDIKYFRYWYDGRVYRGRVYYDLNMNWIVILNKKDTRVISCWELFDLAPEDNLHRVKDPTRSKGYKKYIAHLEKLESEKTKDLVIELKRRGYAVKIERK